MFIYNIIIITNVNNNNEDPGRGKYHAFRRLSLVQNACPPFINKIRELLL